MNCQVFCLLVCLTFLGRLSATNYIIDGENVVQGAAPYQVGLFKSGVKEIQCGGSIIAPKTIVTAAHCFIQA